MKLIYYFIIAFIISGCAESGFGNLIGITYTLEDGTVVGSDCQSQPDGGKICKGFLPDGQEVMLHFDSEGKETQREPIKNE